MSTSHLPAVRDQVLASTAKMLTAYRKLCAAQIEAGQLILPESMKILPVYTLGLLKSAAFRAGTERRAFDPTPGLLLIVWNAPSHEGGHDQRGGRVQAST